MEDRVKTGIKGLDELIGGGLPKNSSILLSGEAGTGKTIFSLQFIYSGAKDFDEAGIYVTFEEKPEELRKEASQFGWDFKKYEAKKKIVIFYSFLITISYNDLLSSAIKTPTVYL